MPRPPLRAAMEVKTMPLTKEREALEDAVRMHRGRHGCDIPSPLNEQEAVEYSLRLQERADEMARRDRDEHERLERGELPWEVTISDAELHRLARGGA